MRKEWKAIEAENEESFAGDRYQGRMWRRSSGCCFLDLCCSLRAASIATNWFFRTWIVSANWHLRSRNTISASWDMGVGGGWAKRAVESWWVGKCLPKGSGRSLAARAFVAPGSFAGEIRRSVRIPAGF